MALIRAQIRIPRDTALPVDDVVMTLHFSGPSLITDLNGLHDNAITPFLNAVDEYLGSLLASPASTRYYNLDDPEPRVPKLIGVTTLTLGGDTMPEEVAITMSFQQTPASGQIQARRRGRIYLGPLITAVGGPVSGRQRVTAATRTALVNAMDALEANAASEGYQWVVYSRMDESAYPVEEGWVDDAFDTVRKRGPAATARTTAVF